MKQVLLNFAPPYLNGELHIGHLYEYCIWYPFYNTLDYESFQKHFTYFQQKSKYKLVAAVGLDVNGLPISRYVKSRTPYPLTNEELFKRCDEMMDLCSGSARSLLSKIGVGELREKVYYKTNDIFFSELVDLILSKDRIKEEEKPRPYCRNCNTVLSNSEIGYELRDLYSYYFKVKYKDQEYEIMTTRPEFLPGIEGVSVNPEDERYRHLVGKKVSVSFLNLTKKVPVYQDPRTHPEVGTGMVYFSKWSNELDVELSRNLNLSSTSSLYTKDLKVIKNMYTQSFYPNDYSVLLENKEFMSIFKKGELRKDVRISVHSERSDCKKEIIYISPKQVVLKEPPLQEKEKLCNRISRDIRKPPENNPILVSPAEPRQTLIREITNLKDWTLSRDLSYYSFIKYFKGRKFSVDTWLMSSLTPSYGDTLFNEEYQVWRLQGKEIIRTWATYSLYLNYLLRAHNLTKANFTRLYIHGHVLDEQNKKISKSKGNGPNVQEILAKYSLNVLRYYFCQKPLFKDFSFKEKELIDTAIFFRKYKNLKRKLELDLGPKAVKRIQKTIKKECVYINSLFENDLCVKLRPDTYKDKLNEEQFNKAIEYFLKESKIIKKELLEKEETKNFTETELLDLKQKLYLELYISFLNFLYKDLEHHPYMVVISLLRGSQVEVTPNIASLKEWIQSLLFFLSEADEYDVKFTLSLHMGHLIGYFNIHSLEKAIHPTRGYPGVSCSVDRFYDMKPKNVFIRVYGLIRDFIGHKITNFQISELCIEVRNLVYLISSTISKGTMFPEMSLNRAEEEYYKTLLLVGNFLSIFGEVL